MEVLFLFTAALGIIFSQDAKSQTTDTLINVGHHSLRFRVSHGIGMPIIFESGTKTHLQYPLDRFREANDGSYRALTITVSILANLRLFPTSINRCPGFPLLNVDFHQHDCLVIICRIVMREYLPANYVILPFFHHKADTAIVKIMG